MSKRPKAVLGTTAETTRRSTRAKIRDESESISQPDTSRLTRSRRNTRTDQGGIERIGLESIQSVTTQTSSGSTAVLPDHFDVLLGCEPGKGPLDVFQAEQVWVQGAEILADARRAGGEEEGRLDHLREVVASRRGGVFVAGTRPEEAAPRDKLKKDIMWYTAAFSVPYTFDLETQKHHWSPRAVPPIHLPPLDFQPAHLNPLIGSSIPPWTVNPLTDIEPLADDLSDFVHQWRDATGSGWGPTKAVQDDWSLDCDEVEGDTITDNPNALDIAEKGASMGMTGTNVIGSSMLFLPPSLTNISKSVALHLPSVKVGANDETDEESPPLFDLHLKRIHHESAIIPRQSIQPRPEESAKDWQIEAKQRKSWWRDETAKEGYGEIWSIIPRPHSLFPKLNGSCQSKSPLPPKYILPRFYSLASSSHPFHPNLDLYIANNPYARVYWSIPIQGPIHIPTYSDHLSTPPPKAPVPSSAQLRSSASILPKSRGALISWTPGLLSHFWSDFLIPLHAHPESFGTISITLSGPKPDPHLSLRSPNPLPPWSTHSLSAHTEQETSADCAGDSVGSRPVRPEMGDHIRIYSPLKSALSLRTWLHAIEVDSNFIKGSTKMEDGPKKLVRLFDKARFVLVGDRGEALIVA